MGSNWIFKPLVWVARKVVTWALDHPFVMRPRWWGLALVAWFAMTGSLLAAGVRGPVVFLPLGVLFLFIVAGTIGWISISSVSDKSAVAVTQFAAKTYAALEAAYYHRIAVLDRLSNGPVGEHLDLRPWHVPVTLRQATRLLDHVPARAALFGSVKAISGTGTWEAQLLMRWPGDEHAPAHVELGDEGDLVVEHFNRQKQAPDRHEVLLEPDVPLGRLIAERFESDHVERAEGTMLALLAAVAVQDGDDEIIAEAFAAANRYREKLSPRTRAALEIVRSPVEAENFEKRE